MSKYLIRISLVLAVVIVAVSPISAAPLPRPGAEPEMAADAVVRLVSADRSGITLELAVPGVTIGSALLGRQQYDTLAVPGLVPGAGAGQPDLPRKIVLLGVPPNAELHLSATVLEVEMLPGHYHLAPVPRWAAPSPQGVGLSAAELPQPVYAADPAIYAAAALYPAEPARIVQTGYVRSQRIASLELSPVRYQPDSGEVQVIRRLRVHLAFHNPAASRQPGAVEEPAFEAILARTLLNYDSARNWRATIAPPQPTRPAAWPPPEPAWKVRVKDTGLYRLTRADLAAAGLPVDTLDPRTFQLYNGGGEVAIYVAGQEDGAFDPVDYVEFYGQALDTLYTDTNVYWLTYGSATGQRMAERDGTPTSAPTPASFVATARIEENRDYWSNAPGDDHWFWQTVTQPVSETFTGTLGLVAADAPTCTVEVSFAGANYDDMVEPDHHARVYLNENLVADAWWDGQTVYTTTVEVSQAYLKNRTNSFRVEVPGDTGATYDVIYVDGFAVEYGHLYRAVDDELAFAPDQPGDWQFRIVGFSGPDVLAFDVTDPAQVVRIVGGISQVLHRAFLPLVQKNQGEEEQASRVIPSTGDGPPAPNRPALNAPTADLYQLRFQDTVVTDAEYLALVADGARTPLAIEPDAPSDLADTGHQADYIVVAHDDLYTSTLSLAAYWETQGLAVQVARLSDVYDEFAYGILDPAAIRDFLAYAYANWQPPQVAYALLVGDGTYDYRDYLGFGARPWIPPYLLASPFVGETASDNWFACVSGEDFLPDLHIGRLPAASAAEADLMVGKVLDYAQDPPPGTWNQDVLFVADDADAAGDFAAYSDVLVNGYLPATYTAHKVYYQITHMTQPEVTAAITGTVNNGTLLVNYIGHATVTYWAHENLLFCYDDRCDLDDMDNGGRLPLVVSMSCADGYYVEPDPAITSLSEQWLLRPGGGGTAVFSATGWGVATGHDYLNRGLFTAVFSDTLALGPATTESKLYLYGQTGDAYRDLIETYHLFGDPRLSLNLP